MPFVLSFALTGYHSRATTCCLQQFTGFIFHFILVHLFYGRTKSLCPDPIVSLEARLTSGRKDFILGPRLEGGNNKFSVLFKGEGGRKKIF